MKTPAIILFALLFAACAISKDPAAKPTEGASKSPVPNAIADAGAKSQAAIAALEAKIAALEKQASVAAAQVDSAKTANTAQPPSPATTVVDKETSLALGNLPPPDTQAALAAEQRRSAVLAGQTEEARKLYNAAMTETQQLKAEIAKARGEADTAKADAAKAQAVLIEAERIHAAQLKANEAVNQAKIDTANKRADAAEEVAKNERHKLIFRSLLGLGLACIAGAIAMGVLTNGVMLGKSLMLAGGGALCIGLGQVISHPLFDRIFGTCIGLAVVGGAAYLWFERKDALSKQAYARTVSVIKDTNAAVDVSGNSTPLGVELSKALDDTHKKIVKGILQAEAIREAKSA